MLKNALLSVVLAGLVSVPAHSQKAVAPKASGSAVSIAPFSATTLNSMFDGSGQAFNVKSFLAAPQNGFAARNRMAAKEAALISSVKSFAEKARALFGNPKIISRRGPHPALSRGERGSNGAPTDGEIDEEMRRSPRDNAERERIVQELFVQAGARPEDIRKQDIGRGKNNFIVVKPGKTDRVIVVGAHHDKVSAGQGTIDNWTGTTMMINLYQQLRDVETEHTYVFIAFGREEEGLVGSAAYVRSLSAAEKGKIDNMVNMDTLAVDGTYSWKNNSDQNLLTAFRETASRENLELNEIVLRGGDADSSSFRRAGIKAVTVFGASPDVIFDIIHSPNDNMGAFVMKHYVNAYKLIAATLLSLDKKPSYSF